MNWTVTGSDKATGAAKTLTLEAPTPQAAGAKAVGMGWAVDSVSPGPARAEPASACAMPTPNEPLAYRSPSPADAYSVDYSIRNLILCSRIIFWTALVYGGLAALAILAECIHDLVRLGPFMSAIAELVPPIQVVGVFTALIFTSALLQILAVKIMKRG